MANTKVTKLSALSFSFSSDDDSSHIDRYIDSYEEMNRLRNHTFYKPINVPNSPMSISVWAVRQPVGWNPSAPSDASFDRYYYYFSVYENGAIIDPASDTRFKEAYLEHFAGRPWVDCAFFNLKQISLFLRYCNIFVSN